MSTILLHEPDTVFAAVLEDHLRVADHQVTRVASLADALARTRTDPVDLAIFDGSSYEIVKAVGMMRRSAETQTTPVLVLSEDGSRDARLASLRAGADEHFARPFDLEELMLRIARLLGRRSPAPQLSGDVRGHPLPDLLQYVQQTGKSGRLTVSDSRGRGEATFERGQLMGARWGQLRGSEAALAMLSLENGQFRFESDAPNRERGGASPLPLQQLLLHAVWLTDELGARRTHLPPTGAPLVARGLAISSEAIASLSDVPLARVFERIRSQEGVRIFDLIAEEMEAPAATRLAVAWLVEHGLIAEDHTELDAPPSTGEITSSMIFDINVAAFLTAAKRAGLDADPLPLLIVADDECRPQLLRMLQGVHGYLQNAPLRSLVEKLADNKGTSSAFDSDRGRLSLHVQFLDGTDRSPIDSVVPICGGVLLWLAGTSLPAAGRRIVERLESSRTVARGIVIATDTAGRSAAEQVTRGAQRWQLTPHEPRSLLGVLRLLEPQTG